MQFSACITTRNRTKELRACLHALWNSSVPPFSVIVSDDSLDSDVQQKNCQVVQQYPGTTYLMGPRLGVCGNRNHALRAALNSGAELIAFIDDDICIEPDFIACALDRYRLLSSKEQSHTILSGVHCNDPQNISPYIKLSFRGYFCPSNVPEAVHIHAAVFPRALLEQEQWDENIFFGYEDAELCLRALKRGYQIVHCPELRVVDIGAKASTLNVPGRDCLTQYEICVEAARLYVGIKRYKDLSPSLLKLLAFVGIYIMHMTAYLLKRRSLSAWIDILRHSRIERLWPSSDSISTNTRLYSSPGSTHLAQQDREA